jgi:hypothetical protein
MFDNIDLTERDCDGDSLILDLFHKWQVALKDADDAGAYIFEEKMDALIEIERRLAGTAASGAVGISIKGFLAAFNARNLDGGLRCKFLFGILEDALRFVPELAPLVEPPRGVERR